MSSGTKLTLVVVLLVFVGSGIYFAFVAPPAAGEKSTNQGVAPPKATAPAPSAPPARRPEQPTGGQRSLGSDRSSSPPANIGSANDRPATDRGESSAEPNRPMPVVSEPRPVEAAPSGEVAAPSPTTSGGTGDDAEEAPARPKVIIVPPASDLPATEGAGTPAATPTTPRVTEPSGPRPVTPLTVPPTRPTTTTGGNTAPGSAARSHTVASGDTMTVLAERYFGDRNKWQVIAKANPLVDPAAMKVGTQLTIPSVAAASAPPPTTPATPAGTPTTAGVTAGATTANVHEVEAGETLYSIARRHYGSPGAWELIYAANRERIGADPAALKVGMRLTLPPRPAARATAGDSR